MGPRFSSTALTVMTTAGLAIGLGNVWRFPYVMGSYGEGAFLYVYIALLLLIAVPMLASEWATGRALGPDPVATFMRSFGPRRGRIISIALVGSLYIATSYYVLIVAQIFFSVLFALTSGFDSASLAQYTVGVTDPLNLITTAAALLALSGSIVYLGLKNGIEHAVRVILPLFVVISLLLAIYVLSLEGAWDMSKSFLFPDSLNLTYHTAFAALGQAFFTLGLGGVVAVSFGRYIPRGTNLVSTAAATAGLDLSAALLATTFVVPLVLLNNLSLSSGPNLLFNTLPLLFAEIEFGFIVAPAFLFGWGCVCFLSIVGPMEVLTSVISNRVNATWCNWVPPMLTTSWLFLIVPIALNPSWIETLDLMFGSVMTIAGAFIALMAFLALPDRLNELEIHSERHWKLVLNVLYRFVCPGMIVLLFVLPVFSSV